MKDRFRFMLLSFPAKYMATIFACKEQYFSTRSVLSITIDPVMHSWKVTFTWLGILPSTATVSLLAFYVFAACTLGYFPAYDHPDPKHVTGYSFFAPLISVTFFLWFISVISWFIMTIGYFICFAIRKDKLPAGPFLWSI